jgi:hypothetical protein
MKEIAAELGITRQAIYPFSQPRWALLRRGPSLRRPARRSRGRQWLDLEPAWPANGAAILARLSTKRAGCRNRTEGAALVGDDGAEAWHDRMRHLRDAQRPFIARLAANGLLAEGWTIDRATDRVWAYPPVRLATSRRRTRLAA